MKKHSIHTALCNILYAVLAFLVVLAAPHRLAVRPVGWNGNGAGAAARRGRLAPPAAGGSRNLFPERHPGHRGRR